MKSLDNFDDIRSESIIFNLMSYSIEPKCLTINNLKIIAFHFINKEKLLTNIYGY